MKYSFYFLVALLIWDTAKANEITCRQALLRNSETTPLTKIQLVDHWSRMGSPYTVGYEIHPKQAAILIDLAIEHGISFERMRVLFDRVDANLAYPKSSGGFSNRLLSSSAEEKLNAIPLILKNALSEAPGKGVSAQIAVDKYISDIRYLHANILVIVDYATKRRGIESVGFGLRPDEALQLMKLRFMRGLDVETVIERFHQIQKSRPRTLVFDLAQGRLEIPDIIKIMTDEK